MLTPSFPESVIKALWQRFGTIQPPTWRLTGQCRPLVAKGQERNINTNLLLKF